MPEESVTASLSVIICAHTEERWELLLAAIDSVRHQTRPADDIVVVIDYNPALLARLQSATSGVRIIPNSGERGLSGARNTGVAASTGAIIAFLDDDAQASPTWLEELAACYTSEDVLGAGGNIEPVWPGKRPAWFPREFDWVVGCTYEGMPQSRQAVRNLIGCNMSFRREVLERTGGFLQGFGTLGLQMKGACRCEETELCIRAGQLWPRGVFIHEPRASVSHHVTPARQAWAYFRARCYSEGLSKAAVRRLASAGRALASERAYVVKALPRGIARGLGQAVVGSDWAGLFRAAAIVTGLLHTTAGYVVGRVASVE